VLIVDDVETNIYVAKGLMAPYGLTIDSADSGFAAIEKIKSGKLYDIVFMDHMMPKMDGIEATKHIRDMGYERPIVALTANAVAGQADIFLANGFNDFISKPINIRQLNTVLNKLIRDNQPIAVIETAKKQAEAITAQSSSQVSHPSIDPHFAEAFARDAMKALTVLEVLSKKNDYRNEDHMRSYLINVHGMKSALANVGRMDLSAMALKLEMAGREGNTEMIESETPAFLNALRAFTEALMPAPKDESSAVDEAPSFIHEQLLKITAACAEYDVNTAAEVLAELRKTKGSKRTSELLGAIAEHLLHSDFEKIVQAVECYTAKQNDENAH
ncbi:MAG: response regulator, partial [Clostridia bacterium]|nr:response regulator [Clostridia bacterium]